MNQCCLRNCIECKKCLDTESAHNTQKNKDKAKQCKMPISTACFLSTTIILPQAYFKYNIFSRRESGKTARTSLIWQHSCYLLKFLSTPSAESVPVLLHDFTLCLSKSRLPCSLSIALPLLTQASHKDDRDTGSQTLIDDALPKKAEASNKDDLKTWFMCVWQFRHTHSYCGLAGDRGRKSGIGDVSEKVSLKAKNWLVSSSQGEWNME